MLIPFPFFSLRERCVELNVLYTAENVGESLFDLLNGKEVTTEGQSLTFTPNLCEDTGQHLYFLLF